MKAFFKKDLVHILFLLIIEAVAFILLGVIAYSRVRSDDHAAFNQDISVGKPCDARNLKSYNSGDNIQNTKGLQCYMYDDLSDRGIHNGAWTYPSGKETSRKGVWIYPNKMNKPIFLSPSLFDTISFRGSTQNWKLYNSEYSFVYPNQWKVEKDQADQNQLIIREENASGIGDAPLRLAIITFYPNTKFESSEDFKMLEEAPDDWLIPDTFNDSFIYTKHFDLNGTPSILVERMGNFDLGTSPYQVTLYIPKQNSYYTITYTKYHDSSIDIPVELLIKSLRLK